MQDELDIKQFQEQVGFQTIMRAIPSGVVVITGSDARITLVNRRAVELYGRTPPIGLPLHLHASELGLFMPDGSPFPTEELPLSRALLHGEEVWGVETIIQHPDGKCLTVLQNAVPLYDEKGDICGAVGAIEDITSLVIAREELNQAYTREHRVSETLQQSLLPHIPERMDSIQIVSAYQAALEEALIGGDFYDVFRPAPNLVGILIGDVSGKGIYSAAHSALVRYTLRAYSYQNPSAGAVIESLNDVVTREIELESFITLLYGVFDPQEDTFSYVNAGHMPPLHLKCLDGKVVELTGEGMAVGIVTGNKYVQNTIRLQKGERILLYTDGVTDARGSCGFFGLERLKEFALSHQNDPPSEFVDNLLKCLQDWSEGRLRDDVAILLISL